MFILLSAALTVTLAVVARKRYTLKLARQQSSQQASKRTARPRY